MRKRLIAFFDLDSAIVFSLISKGFSLIAQPAMLFLISSRLSPEGQGYYYTFYSVIALTIFMELGLGVVITHFSSNEFGSLRWTETGGLAGNEVALSRLLSILRKSLGWYGAIVLISTTLLIPLGLALFRSKAGQSDVNYAWPWVCLMLATAMGTWLIPVVAMLGGSDRIADVQRIRFVQNIVGSIVFCLALLGGARLYAPAMLQTGQTLVFVVWFVASFRGLTAQLVRRRSASDAEVSWLKEILPMQWKVGLSWMSLYFISSTHNPLLFAFRGPTEAGQMGMSRAIAEMIAGVGMPWVSTRSVTYGIHVGRRDYASLDRVALRATLQGMAVATCAGLAAVVGYFVVRHVSPDQIARVLPISGFAMLIIGTIGGIGVNSVGEYLRAHKVEPYLRVNLILAVLVTISNVVSAKFFDTNTMAVAFVLVTTLVGWPLAAQVFLTKRREWRQAGDANGDRR